MSDLTPCTQARLYYTRAIRGAYFGEILRASAQADWWPSGYNRRLLSGGYMSVDPGDAGKRSVLAMGSQHSGRSDYEMQDISCT